MAHPVVYLALSAYGSLSIFILSIARFFFSKITQKEINRDKILRDIPLLAIYVWRMLAREFPDVPRDQNSIDTFYSLFP